MIGSVNLYAQVPYFKADNDDKVVRLGDRKVDRGVEDGRRSVNIAANQLSEAERRALLEADQATVNALKKAINSPSKENVAAYFEALEIRDNLFIEALPEDQREEARKKREHRLAQLIEKFFPE